MVLSGLFSLLVGLMGFLGPGCGALLPALQGFWPTRAWAGPGAPASPLCRFLPLVVVALLVIGACAAAPVRLLFLLERLQVFPSPAGSLAAARALRALALGE